MGKKLVRGKIMEIREMTGQDIPQMAQMEKAYFSYPWSEAAFAHEMESPIALWLVAAEGATVVGYIGSQISFGEADMMNLAVRQEYRRQQMGEQLVRRLIKCLRARGVTSLSLEVRASNQPAIALYEKLGFAAVGCRRGYYRNPREDGLIYRKEWS